MEDNIKTNKTDEANKTRIPLKDELLVKDLINPINIKRIRILQVAGALVLLAVIAVVVKLYFFKPPTGEQLVNDMIEAAGGVNAWDNIDHGQFVRTHRRYDENKNIIKQEKETYYFRKENENVRIMVKSESDKGDEIIIGNNKDGYWASKNDEPAEPREVAKDLEMMCHAEHCTPLCASEMAFYRMSFPFKLKDPGVNPQYAGTSILNGKKAMVLDVTYKPEIGIDRWVFLVDPKTKLIRKIEHYGSAEADAQPEEIYWTDYKDEAGISFSHVATSYRSNGSILEEFIITDEDFTSPMQDGYFQRPVAMK
jgi:hypothetical protein